MDVPFNKVKWDNNNQFGIHRNKIGITFPALILTITCGTKNLVLDFFFERFIIKAVFERKITDHSPLCNSFT